MMGLKCSSTSGSSPAPASVPTDKSMDEIYLYLMTPPNNGVVPGTVRNRQQGTHLSRIISWYSGLALDNEIKLLRLITVCDPGVTLC